MNELKKKTINQVHNNKEENQQTEKRMGKN